MKMRIGFRDEEDASYGKSQDEPSDKRPSLSGMARKRAARAVLDAIEGGDAGALDMALEEHYRACSDG